MTHDAPRGHSGGLFITDPTDIDKMIARASAWNKPHTALLLRAARKGLFTLITPRRDNLVPAGLLESPRPTLVVPGDDDDASTGPSGWRAWPQVAPWAGEAMVLAAAADLAAYVWVNSRTLVMVPHYLLMETSSACAPAWIAALEAHGVGALVVAPEAGEHPVPPPRGTLQ